MIGIVEIIAPEGDTKKFVFLVTQIMVSIVIAVPIFSLFKNDFEFEDVFNISYIEESSFYIDTLRNSVERQAEILEEVFSEKIVNEFNEKYSDIKLSECKIYFIRDPEGKIKEINLVEVEVINDTYCAEDVKMRVSEICEVSSEKIKIK